jgi:hypothetical protein
MMRGHYAYYGITGRGLTPITFTKCAYDLARNGWQSEPESDIVSDGGCGSVAGRVQGGLNTHSLREFNVLLHIRQLKPTPPK